MSVPPVLPPLLPGAGDDPAPEGAEEQVALADARRQEGDERVGEDAARNDPRHGTHDVALIARADNERHEQDVHDDGLKADGKVEAERVGDGGKHRRKAGHAARGEPVGDLEDVNANGEHKRARDDERRVTQRHAPGDAAHDASPSPPTTHRW